MRFRGAFLGIVAASGLLAQPAAPAPTDSQAQSAPEVEEAKTVQVQISGYVVDTGTKVPLTLINSVSTKHSVEGDRVYLQTVYPIMVNGRIVIPPGSYVAGTVTEVTARAGQQVAMDAQLAVIEPAPEDGRQDGDERS